MVVLVKSRKFSCYEVGSLRQEIVLPSYRVLNPYGLVTALLVLIKHKHRQRDAYFVSQIQLKSLFEELGIDLVLDVGANRGQFGSQIREFYKGQIASFEPITSVFADLKRASAGDSLWQIYNWALGEEECSRKIFVSNLSTFSSMLRPTDFSRKRFGSQSEIVREEEICVRRLDSVIKQEIPDWKSKKIFLKLDTQGYDLAAFRGLGVYTSDVQLLQSELSLLPIYDNMPHWTDSVQVYEKAGFHVAAMYPVNWDANRVVEYDCVMVRS